MAWQGGGVIFTPEGQKEIIFSSELGMETNNIAEALALWQGLLIAKNQGIIELIALGDSRIIIQAMTENSLPNQMHLKQLIQKIKLLSLSFFKIEFYHVLRKNNKEANRAANSSSSLSFGELKNQWD